LNNLKKLAQGKTLIYLCPRALEVAPSDFSGLLDGRRANSLPSLLIIKFKIPIREAPVKSFLLIVIFLFVIFNIDVNYLMETL